MKELAFLLRLNTCKKAKVVTIFFHLIFKGPLIVEASKQLPTVALIIR